MNDNRLEISLDDGCKMVVEKYNPDTLFPSEFSVYIEDSEGNIIQDIALIHPHYSFDFPTNSNINNSIINVKVYSDCNNEDFTHDIEIDVHKDIE